MKEFFSNLFKQLKAMYIHMTVCTLALFSALFIPSVAFMFVGGWTAVILMTVLLGGGVYLDYVHFEETGYTAFETGLPQSVKDTLESMDA
jgi:hypothetical protein